MISDPNKLPGDPSLPPGCTPKEIEDRFSEPPEQEDSDEMPPLHVKLKDLIERKIEVIIRKDGKDNTVDYVQCEEHDATCWNDDIECWGIIEDVEPTLHEFYIADIDDIKFNIINLKASN